jgi:phosphatidate cytidylyltransferase
VGYFCAFFLAIAQANEPLKKRQLIVGKAGERVTGTPPAGAPPKKTRFLLLRRILTVAVLFFLIRQGLYGRYAPHVFFVVVVSITYLSQMELYNLLERQGFLMWRLCGIAAALALNLCGYLRLLDYRHSGSLMAGTLVGLFLFTFVLQLRRGLGEGTRTIMATFFGFFYVACPLATLYWIRKFEHGGTLIALLLIATAFGDVGGYAGGSLFGRHKFSPRISPNKTWEGAVGAMVLSISAVLLGGVLFMKFGSEGLFYFDTAARALPHALILAVVIGVLGMMGDLAESLIKRESGVKDSGGSLTGHGGFLDMVDSLLLTAPIVLVYAFFVLD